MYIYVVCLSIYILRGKSTHKQEARNGEIKSDPQRPAPSRRDGTKVARDLRRRAPVGNCVRPPLPAHRHPNTVPRRTSAQMAWPGEGRVREEGKKNPNHRSERRSRRRRLPRYRSRRRGREGSQLSWHACGGNRLSSSRQRGGATYTKVHPKLDRELSRRIK